MCTAESFGKTHDFALYKNSIGSRVLDSIKAQADSGYQGITAIHHNSETPKKKKSRGKKIPSNIAETRVVVVDIFGNKMTMEEAKKLLNTVVEKDGKFYKCVRIEDLPQNMKLKPK